MRNTVEVRLREQGNINIFITDIELNPGDSVIVEQDRGIDWGQVVSEMGIVLEDDAKEMRRVIRKITPQDLEQIEENKKSTSSALKVCEKKVKEHNLGMQLIDAEYVFDRTKIIFYFTAEGRVDFRELVKDLAKIFKIRIELRQIGVRDEAKFFGGYGVCGRPLCCTSFLKNFIPVSIRLAKEQQIPLHPQKISGICGRLMCCLSFEYEVYKDILNKFPKLGESINTSQGRGKVVGYNPLKKKVYVEIDEERIIEHTVE